MVWAKPLAFFMPLMEELSIAVVDFSIPILIRHGASSRIAPGLQRPPKPSHLFIKPSNQDHSPTPLALAAQTPKLHALGSDPGQKAGKHLPLSRRQTGLQKAKPFGNSSAKDLKQRDLGSPLWPTTIARRSGSFLHWAFCLSISWRWACIIHSFWMMRV